MLLPVAGGEGCRCGSVRIVQGEEGEAQKLDTSVSPGLLLCRPLRSCTYVFVVRVFSCMLDRGLQCMSATLSACSFSHACLQSALWLAPCWQPVLEWIRWTSLHCESNVSNIISGDAKRALQDPSASTCMASMVWVLF